MLRTAYLATLVGKCSQEAAFMFAISSSLDGCILGLVMFLHLDPINNIRASKEVSGKFVRKRSSTSTSEYSHPSVPPPFDDNALEVEHYA